MPGKSSNDTAPSKPAAQPDKATPKAQPPIKSSSWPSGFWVLALLAAAAAYYFTQNGELQYIVKRTLRSFQQKPDLAVQVPPVPTDAAASASDWRTDGLPAFKEYVKEFPSLTTVLLRPNGGGDEEKNISLPVDWAAYENFETLAQEAAIALGMGDGRRYYITTYSGIHIQYDRVLTAQGLCHACRVPPPESL